MADEVNGIVNICTSNFSAYIAAILPDMAEIQLLLETIDI
jgi:hypothetical protein